MSMDVRQKCSLLGLGAVLFLVLASSGQVLKGFRYPGYDEKGQFLAPGDVRNILAKLESTGNRQVVVTERGVSFGYNNLVADMRSLPLLREFGYPVVFDATHSVQLPGGAGDRSSGDARLAATLARAAVAAGCDAIFIETHLNPAEALSDKDTQLPLAQVKKLWRLLSRIDALVRKE